MKDPARNMRRFAIVAALALWLLIGACVSRRADTASQHRWWSGLGPVLPHDTFPANCSLCHVGDKWGLLEHFTFNHAARTGVKLEGAHNEAKCLRCHNDRGPVRIFQAKGCVGCHEDFHNGDLGTNCAECHGEQDWRPVGMIEMHNRTRFPLTGVHALTACHRCHVGARFGKFVPNDTECVTCHRADLAQAVNPNHVGLGWVDNCDRCHMPTRWQQATTR